MDRNQLQFSLSTMRFAIVTPFTIGRALVDPFWTRSWPSCEAGAAWERLLVDVDDKETINLLGEDGRLDWQKYSCQPGSLGSSFALPRQGRPARRPADEDVTQAEIVAVLGPGGLGSLLGVWALGLGSLWQVEILMLTQRACGYYDANMKKEVLMTCGYYNSDGYSQWP